jgi:hypothetical protein
MNGRARSDALGRKHWALDLNEEEIPWPGGFIGTQPGALLEHGLEVLLDLRGALSIQFAEDFAQRNHQPRQYVSAAKFSLLIEYLIPHDVGIDRDGALDWIYHPNLSNASVKILAPFARHFGVGIALSEYFDGDVRHDLRHCCVWDFAFGESFPGNKCHIRTTNLCPQNSHESVGACPGFGSTQIRETGIPPRSSSMAERLAATAAFAFIGDFFSRELTPVRSRSKRNTKPPRL